jgi:tricorn protease
MFRKLTLLAVFAFASIAAPAQPNAGQPLLITRIALNQTHVAFVHAGKIWLVPRNGGEAKRLTNTPNEEGYPVFSPDGKRIAFSRSNGNDWDVFIINSDGSGEPFRATMMPEDDYVTCWSPDGKEVIFETTRDEENVSRLYKTSTEHLELATALPLQQGYVGSISPDGSRIAYNPRLGAGDWRYYRGGFAAPLWIANMKTGALEKVSTGASNDKGPLWNGDKIYFVSDRSGVFNLHVYDTSSKKVRQLTPYNDKGVRAASVFHDTAAYVQDGRIHLFNLMPGGADQLVNFTISPDTSELAPRTASAMRSLEQILPSASGDKLILGARGDVLTYETSTGTYKDLTNTPGIAERYPVMSPDGKSVAYFSDESGEYAIHVRSLSDDSVRKIAIEPKPSFYWNLAWSPDSKSLIFNDRRLQLWIADVATSRTTRIDTSEYTGQDSWAPSFSHDSRYVAYAKTLKNRTSAVFIYDISAKRSFQVTDGITHAFLPAFDPNGKYLYFASSPNAGTTDFPWGVLNSVLANPMVVSRVHALVLTKDQPLPLLGNGQPNPDAKSNESIPQVRIDQDGMQNRFVNIPVPPRDYSQLVASRPGKLMLIAGEWGAAPGDLGGQQQNTAVYQFDISKGGQLTKIVDGIDSVDLTQDGAKILYRKGRDFYLTSADEPVKPDAPKQDLSKVELRVVPAEEWRQMFHESVRIMRDWFYDTNYHGRNLGSLEAEYAQYLPTITRRSDLNVLMRQMLGSVSVSHLGVGGGDTSAAISGSGGNRIGLLGADYEIANGKYRFKKIYRSTSYSSPNGSINAPLDAQGVDVRDGDYLLKVNDQIVDASKNVLTYFQDAINRPTKITVSTDANGGNPRTYTVFPTNGENRLRRANWAEANRKLVEKLSGGKLGYIFIEGYNPDGIMNAIRGLTGFSDKNGVIIDQRYNGGGVTPDYLIEWMQRRPLYYYMFRGGEDIATPVNPAPPVKVMIINELNGSAAETGAFMFKLGKVGPLVGKRTYGGGIGPYFFTPTLIDGGRVQLPGRAAYDPSGTNWGIENSGVAPDYDVDFTPADVIAGRDPQLEKAIEIALAQIPKHPMYAPKRPAFPVHPGEQATPPTGGVLMSALPQVGSAFPAPVAKSSPAAAVGAPSVTDGKFAAVVGSYDAGPMGVLVVRQEGEKLWAIAPNAERIELVPESTPDRYMAQPVGAPVSFERDPTGKVIGITVLLPGNREVKGKKTS